MKALAKKWGTISREQALPVVEADEFRRFAAHEAEVGERAALSGKPCLAEEWGGCTSPNGGPSTVWEWASYGNRRAQFMANEDEFAAYVAATLTKLVEVGSPGALLWCFADYAPDLWDRPPCEATGATHERHFGLVRPDGALKPHASVIKDFAASGPTTRRATRIVDLDVTADEYDRDPGGHARRLYEGF